MTKTPITLQDLRRRLYVKAKAEPSWRFWDHLCAMRRRVHRLRRLKKQGGKTENRSHCDD